MRPTGRPETLWGTLRQSAPQVGPVVRHMRPTWRFRTLASVTPAFLSRHGIEGVIWDVDGTLTAYHHHQLDPSVEPTLRALVALPNVRHAIVSNSPEGRFAALGTLFPTMRVVRVYNADGVLHPRTLFHGEDSMTPEARAALDNAGAYALRKPSRQLLEQTLAVLECRASQVVMIGDQYLTDIAGAGMAGVRSIKVDPIVPTSFPLSLRAAQLAERVLFAGRYGRSSLSDPSFPEKP